MRFNWVCLKDVEKISVVFLYRYRRLEFRYSLADVLIYDINWTEVAIEKNPDNFLLFWDQIHAGIFCRIPFNPYLSELYIPPFLVLQGHVIPVFIRSIATHPNHIVLFRMAGIPNVVWSRLPTFKSRKSILPETASAPSPSPSYIPSTLVAPSHDRFYLLNSLSLMERQINRNSNI